ncbi:hypothetical protein LINPERHAP1_LOCUS37998 [Linum perenne]
MGFPI